MKHVTIDFTNQTILISTHQETIKKEKIVLNKNDFSKFIPKKYIDYNSFTWNFQNETFSVNQENKSLNNCYKPQFIIPMNGLKKHFKEFSSLIKEEHIKIHYTSKLKEFLRF